MATEFLKGKAALDELTTRHQLPDWQAKKVLATARMYGVNNIPVKGGYDVLGIEYMDGTYAIGPMKLVIK